MSTEMLRDIRVIVSTKSGRHMEAKAKAIFERHGGRYKRSRQWGRTRSIVGEVGAWPAIPAAIQELEEAGFRLGAIVKWGA